MTTSLPRGSIEVSGDGERLPTAKLVICASGYALPMASASTTGIPRCAAASSGCMPLPPADLDRHHRLELAAKVLFHRRDGAGNQPAVDRPFQDDEGRAHHRHH